MANATVCLTFDFDAVSPWVLREDVSPTQLSRGVFGADVGVPRLLDLLAEYGVEATFFVPGHTVESFPEPVERIHAAGHGIQHHGWSHTAPTDFADRAAERADVERGIESIERVTGSPPAGYRSPSWDFSEHTLGILEEFGFAWDSSQMADDFTPYRLREVPSVPEGAPYERGEPTDVLEFPVSWKRDDFPAFAYQPDGLWGFADEREVFGRWADEVDWMCDHVEDGVFTLTMHPQVTGHARPIRALETFVRHVDGRPDARFARLGDVALDLA